MSGLQSHDSLFFSPADPCSESLCQNGATCTSLSPLVGRMMLMNFNCTCPRGYVGTFCEISVAVECDTNPCENGGVCRELEVRKISW